MTRPIRRIAQQDLRFQDPQGNPIALVRVSKRVTQNTFLMLPNQIITSIIAGVVGKAQEQHHFPIYAYAFLPHFYTMLIGVYSAQQLARIQEFINGNISRELGRKDVLDYEGSMWADRPSVTILLDDTALHDTLKDILAHGVTEGFVARPQKMPGLHCAEAICSGFTQSGIWTHRVELIKRQRRKNQKKRKGEKGSDVFQPVSVHLSKLPCWQHYDDYAYRQAVSALCRVISEEAEQQRDGKEVLGEAALLKRNPRYQLKDDELHRQAPGLVLAADEKEREQFIRDYRQYNKRYYQAHQRLKRGITSFDFPEGCIPPGCYQPVGGPRREHFETFD